MKKPVESLYAVQTILKLDNRIINQKMLLFSACNEEQARSFVKKEIDELNAGSITETLAVSITKYPMQMVVQSAAGGHKTFKVIEI